MTSMNRTASRTPTGSRTPSAMDSQARRESLFDSAAAQQGGITAGLTLMHAAAFTGSTVLTQLLLASGEPAECSTTDETFVGPAGSRPVHVAAALGHVDILRLLLQHGVDINVANKARISRLQTADGRRQL